MTENTTRSIEASIGVEPDPVGELPTGIAAASASAGAAKMPDAVGAGAGAAGAAGAAVVPELLVVVSSLLEHAAVSARARASASTRKTAGLTLNKNLAIYNLHHM